MVQGIVHSIFTLPIYVERVVTFWGDRLVILAVVVEVFVGVYGLDQLIKLYWISSAP